MEEKHFNRIFITFIIYIISIVLLLSGTILFIYTFSIESWEVVGVSLVIFTLGLMILAIAINKSNEITIDYKNKEVLSYIKFNNKDKFCIPFDSIINVYIYNEEQLKKEIKLKKYPKEILIIERKYHKEFIPLKWFKKETINLLKEELFKVRDNNENNI